MKILYAGESEVGGPANYLLAILRALRAAFLHLPPSRVLRPTHLEARYDAIVLSDFPAKNCPLESQKIIARQVEGGAGLLMIGGWGSFSGPHGGWQGTLVEKLLPVTCLGRDDRLHFPGGAWIRLKKKPPMFHSVSFKNPPMICGLNQLKPHKGGRVILAARPITIRKGCPHLDRREYPLLVIHSNPRRRTAALATDLAPHWSGGLVDWGRRRIWLRVNDKIQIEVGALYVRFVSDLLRWLAGKR